MRIVSLAAILLALVGAVTARAEEPVKHAPASSEESSAQSASEVEPSVPPALEATDDGNAGELRAGDEAEEVGSENANPEGESPTPELEPDADAKPDQENTAPAHGLTNEGQAESNDAQAGGEDAELAELLSAVERMIAQRKPSAGPRAIEPESVPPALSSELPARANAPAPAPALGPELDWLAGLELPDLPVRWDDRLTEQLLYYRDNPQGRAVVRALVERSGRYAEMIRAQLREAKLPEDLLYVVLVESGYDPLARSSAGAVGLWQFVETTGRDYGLSIDRFVDERMHPERSTAAAVKFLADLHQKLGSWPLSMAAFNMGYGALLRSVRKYNTNDFGALARIEAGLPYETIVYVNKIIATAIVARNPERFGLGDLVREQPLAVTEVIVPGGLGLGRLARAAGISVEKLAELNPELIRSRIPPDAKDYRLRIPSDRAERFAARFAELQPDKDAYGVHLVRFGERIKDIARMYGTTEQKLRALNDLADDEEVAPLSSLRVPDVEPAAPEEQESLVVGVPSGPFELEDREQVFYAVQTGDSAPSIAAFFGVALDELRQWNDIATDAALQSGMVLQLFVAKDFAFETAVLVPKHRVKTLVVGSEEFFEHHESLRDRVRVRYRIKEGDSLDSLSERFDLSVGSIARINGFSRYSKLEKGREIILYVPTRDADKLLANVSARTEPGE